MVAVRLERGTILLLFCLFCGHSYSFASSEALNATQCKELYEEAYASFNCSPTELICEDPSWLKYDYYEEITKLCPTIEDAGGLRNFCSKPEWRKTMGCKAKQEGYVRCTGLFPMQEVYEEGVCDGKYDCVDRTDEQNCAHVKRRSTEIEVIRSPKLSTFVECPLPPETASESGFESGVMIGDTCYRPDHLCGWIIGSNLTLEAQYHPQHIALCRNKTFWESDPRLVNICADTAEQRGCLPPSSGGLFGGGTSSPFGSSFSNAVSSRPAAHHCTGNFPGTCTCAGDQSPIDKCNIQVFGPHSNSCGWDMSDRVFCNIPFSSNCDGDIFELFTCKDKLTCMDKALVCDGHKQCQDGSDEDPEVCSKCSERTFGYPMYGDSGEPWTATFSCKHRYTGLPICATPCDGRDDLCEGNADEQCERNAFVALGAGIAIVLLIAAAFWPLADRFFGTKLIPGAEEVTDESNSLSKLLHFGDDYDLRRSEGAFGQHFLNALTVFSHTAGLARAQELAQKCYKIEKSKHAGSERKTDLYYFERLETGAQTETFFDMVDDGFFFRLKKTMLQRVGRLDEALRTKRATQLKVGLGICVSVALHYSDLVKDVFFIAHFKRFMLAETTGLEGEGTANNGFAVVVFYIAVASILLSEGANLIVLVLHKEFSAMTPLRKILSVAFLPLMPLAVRCGEGKVKWQEAELLHQAGKAINATNDDKNKIQAPTESEILQLRNKFLSLYDLRSKFRGNERLLEHFVQLVLLATVILVDRSETRSVDTLGKVVLDNDFRFVVVSAGLSFISLVRGHVFFLKAKKQGQLPFKGTVLVLLYFFVGAVARVTALLLFLTPTLGLLGVLNHGLTGQIGMEYWMVMDFTPSGKVNAYEVWEENFKIGSVSEIFTSKGTTGLMCALTVTILIIHVAAAHLINRKFFNLRSERSFSSTNAILHTFVCPPLFLDWQNLAGGSADAIAASWKRSQTGLLSYVGLFAAEHLMLSVPLMVLKYVLEERNQKMTEDFFPPIADELRSMEIIDGLLFGGLVAFLVVIPVIQVFLALLYLKMGHAWSRILSREVAVFPWDRREEDTAQESHDENSGVELLSVNAPKEEEPSCAT